MRVRGASHARWIVPLGGLVLLAVLFVQLGAARILWLLKSVGWNLPLIVAIFAAHECVRALALGRCVSSDRRPPFRRLLWVRFLGESLRSLTHTGPFLSEPARGWMLARQGLQGAYAYGAAVSELIANSAVSSLVAAVALGLLMEAFELSRPLLVLSRTLFWISVGYVAVVVIALATRTYLIGAILARVATLPVVGARLRVDAAQVRTMEDAVMQVLRDRPATTAQIVLLELVAQGILVFEVYWSLRSMGVAVSMGTALLVEALTKLANTIQFVGATEGGYALVFTWLGMTGAVGFTLSLVKRVRSLAVAAVGLGVLTLLGRSWSDGAARNAAPPSP